MRAVGCRLDKYRSSFRFLDLPKELRPQILTYTDLVTPLCEVEWNPKKGFISDTALGDAEVSGIALLNYNMRASFEIAGKTQTSAASAAITTLPTGRNVIADLRQRPCS